MYTFDPKPDITAYEVALLVKRIGWWDTILATNETYETDMPDPLKRHFKEVEPADVA